MWDLIVSVPDHCLSFYFAYFWFGSGFQTHFILMKQTLTKSVWDLVIAFSHLPMESDDPLK